MTIEERESIFGKIDLPIKRILTPKLGKALTVSVGSFEDEEFRDNKKTQEYEMKVPSPDYVVVRRSGQSWEKGVIFEREAINKARIESAPHGQKSPIRKKYGWRRRSDTVTCPTCGRDVPEEQLEKHVETHKDKR